MRRWSPRRTRLVGLLAVVLGAGLLAVLPAQYGSPPQDLHLYVEAILLYASTVAGPLLVTWGTFTFRERQLQSLTTRRLLLALALSIGVVAVCNWRMAVLSPDNVSGDVVGPPPHFVPAYPYFTWPDPVSSPLQFLVRLWNPAAIGTIGVGFSIVATTLLSHGRRAALALGTLATTGLLVLGVDVLNRVDSLLLVPLYVCFALVPFAVGWLLVDRRAERKAHETGPEAS